MHRRSWILILIIASFVFLPTVIFAAGDECYKKVSQQALDSLEIKTGIPGPEWSCQKIDPNTTAKDSCVVDACPGYDQTTVRCCIPNVGDSKIDAPGADAKDGTAGGGSAGSIQLSGCVENGNCSLDDIIRTGVNLSQFLFGLSGAIFLGIFVYAGLLYLLSGGNSKNAGKGKEMMVHAVIGMIIIFAAGTIVRFVYVSLTRQAPGATQCEQELGRQGYSCQVIGGGEDELEARGCRHNKGKDSMCRIPGQDENVFCCPIDAPEPKKKDDADEAKTP